MKYLLRSIRDWVAIWLVILPLMMMDKLWNKNKKEDQWD